MQSVSQNSPCDSATANPAPRVSKAERRRTMIDLYDAGLTVVFLGVPRDRVEHLPCREKADRSKPYLQCAAFERGSCPMKDSCSFVHANLAGIQSHPIHVNYVWRSLDDIPYERLATTPQCDEFCVSAPNHRPPTKWVPASAILVTRGSMSALQAGNLNEASTGSQCAHFYFNRMCNRGQNCLYIHVVTVDAQATGELQLAAAPVPVGPNNASDVSTPSIVLTPVSHPCTPPLAHTNGSGPVSAHSGGFQYCGPKSPLSRCVSALSLPVTSAQPSAPTSGEYSDADIMALMSQCPSDLDDVCPENAKTPRRSLKLMDPLNRRTVFYDAESKVQEAYSHNPYLR